MEFVSGRKVLPVSQKIYSDVQNGEIFVGEQFNPFKDN